MGYVKMRGSKISIWICIECFRLPLVWLVFQKNDEEIIVDTLDMKNLGIKNGL